MDPPCKQFKHSNDDAEKHYENKMQSNTLLQLFINYVLDDTGDEYLGINDVELINWLASEELDVNTEEWYLSNKLDIRTATKIEFLNVAESDEDFQREMEQMNKNIMYAKLAYELRSLLPILVACDDNLKYVNDKEQTILHVFIEEFLMNKEYLSEDEIFGLEKLIKSLVEKGVPVCFNDKTGKTPLEIAISCKNKQVLKLIVSNLTDLKECDQHGNSALHILIKNCVDVQDHREDFVDLVQILISKGADVNIKNQDGVAPIHLAAEKFHTKILKVLADNGMNFTERTKDRKTALHFACRSTLVIKSSTTMVETIDALVSGGIEVEAFDKMGRTAFHYAVEFSTIEVIDRLMKYVRNIDCQTTVTLLTPLYLASKSNRLPVMKMLVEAGARVDAEAIDGTTALFMAALWGTYESVKYLIDMGSDIYRRDNVVGFNLLHVAAYGAEEAKPQSDEPNSNSSEIEVKAKPRKIDFFIGKDFDVNDPANCDISPLLLATHRENYDNVKILIEKGANVNFQAYTTSLTALHISILRSNWEIMKLLLENKANVNCRGGKDLSTPLHMALAVEFKWGLGRSSADLKPYYDISYMKNFLPEVNKNVAYPRYHLVRLLVRCGAALDLKDCQGKTPIHLAAHHPKNAALKEILPFGPRINVKDNAGEMPLHLTVRKNDHEGLRWLLSLGQDIHDEDTSELIMNSNGKLRDCAIMYFIKLNLLGLHVPKVYETFMKEPEFANFHKLCSNEVKGLAEYRIFADFSLYIFLRADRKIQYLLIDRILNSPERFLEKFPIYAIIIVGAFCEAVNRKFLLESARIAWDKIFDFDLPELCIQNILRYLENKYLEVFTTCLNDDEIIFLNNRVKSVLMRTN